MHTLCTTPTGVALAAHSSRGRLGTPSSTCAAAPARRTNWRSCSRQARLRRLDRGQCTSGPSTRTADHLSTPVPNCVRLGGRMGWRSRVSPRRDADGSRSTTSCRRTASLLAQNASSGADMPPFSPLLSREGWTWLIQLAMFTQRASARLSAPLGDSDDESDDEGGDYMEAGIDLYLSEWHWAGVICISRCGRIVGSTVPRLAGRSGRGEARSLYGRQSWVRIVYSREWSERTVKVQ